MVLGGIIRAIGSLFGIGGGDNNESISEIQERNRHQFQQYQEQARNDAERQRREYMDQLDKDRQHQDKLREIQQQAIDEMKRQQAIDLEAERSRFNQHMALLNAQSEDARKAHAETTRQMKHQLELMQDMQTKQLQSHEDEMKRLDKRLEVMAEEQREARKDQTLQRQQMEKQLTLMTTQFEQLKEFLVMLQKQPSKGAPMPAKTPEEVAKLRQEAQAKYGIDSVRFYNFGFIGNSGVGKSSLINAIRGLRASDPGAALIDEVECTSKMQKFSYPNVAHVFLWDIPGAATVKHPAETYFWDKKLYALDGLIIVFADRLLQVDIEMAKSAKQYGVPFMFVRTKSDQALDSKIEQKCMTPENAKQELRQQVNRIAEQQLTEEGIRGQNVCCVSSRGFTGNEEQQETYGMDEAKLVNSVAKTAIARRI